MKFNSRLNPIVISLFTLAFLQVQNPAIALVHQGALRNFPSNLGLDTSQKISKKQPIHIARDVYWGSQRDFKITMPGYELENTAGKLMSMNTTTKTIYMIFYENLPSGAYYWTSKETRQVLQTAMRNNLDTNGKVIKSTNMVVEGYPGIELLIQHSDGSQGQYQGYVVRGRLYLLGARATDELTTEAANFFDSFRVYPTRIVSY
jgi:hypothetical protein